ncbi:MAG: hypothetical protein EOO29_30305 [Comamonadaceae bacterium]|nr:MAG: hypothetical protein EOO29_30305 [Comamonadaceae bacterium]
MAPFDLFLHLIGFAAPALAVGILVALGARLVVAGPAGRPWWMQSALNSLVGLAVLAGGLWYWGVDGKMATYAALVLAISTRQWLGARAWRG